MPDNKHELVELDEEADLKLVETEQEELNKQFIDWDDLCHNADKILKELENDAVKSR